MTVVAGKRVPQDGLVFSYDMNNPKSWRGKPTTNHIYYQNPRIDESYAPYTRTATWNANHPDAITVYNTDGGNISNYVNEGVNGGVWETTYHAIWTYEQELKKPVVTLRDVDNVWKAKSFALPSTSYTSMGLSHGDYYTLSWLQWTNDINKTINAGLYVAHIDTGVRSFYDGMSPNAGANAYNTKANTWQRIYATFQVSTSVNLSASVNLYMYGHRGGGGTIKLSDVQLETGDIPSGFSYSQQRTSSQSLLDLSNGHMVTVNELTYNAENTFSFAKNSDLISFENPTPSGSPHTIIQWVRADPALPDETHSNFRKTPMVGPSPTWNPGYWLTARVFRVHAATEYRDYTINWVNDTSWHMIGQTFDGATVKHIIDGEVFLGNRTSYSPNSQSSIYIGAETVAGSGASWKGDIPMTMFYNRVLSIEEIKQIYNASKSRFGL